MALIDESNDSQDRYLMPILRILSDGKVHRCEPSFRVDPGDFFPGNKGMCGQIAAMLQLSPAQMQIKDNEGYKWQHNIRWAISALCRSMAIRNYGGSKYSITDYGRVLYDEGRGRLIKRKLPSHKWWLVEVSKLNHEKDPANLWDDMTQQGIVELPDRGFGDLSDIKQKPDFLRMVDRTIDVTPDQTKAITKLYWSFRNTIEPENFIFARIGDVLFGFGEVTSEYQYVYENHVRLVKWHAFDAPVTVKLDEHPALYSLEAGSKERLRVEKAVESVGLRPYEDL